jgi:ribosome-binding factor A
MPREFSRSQRMAEQIRRDLAEIVREELKDPRLGLFSFTEVKLSKDLSNAIVFCSVLEDDRSDETIETLNHAAGFLRSRIAERMHSRTVPVFRFLKDVSAERGEAMDALIRKAVSADEAKHPPPNDESNENDNEDDSNGQT